MKPRERSITLVSSLGLLLWKALVLKRNLQNHHLAIYQLMLVNGQHESAMTIPCASHTLWFIPYKWH
eukprot:scaffold9100_cov116-Cylindrotheca_fusiformis.AAC.3